MNISRNESDFTHLNDREPVHSTIVSHNSSFSKEVGFVNRQLQSHNTMHKPNLEQPKSYGYNQHTSPLLSLPSTQERLNFSEIQEQDEFDPESIGMQTGNSNNFPYQPYPSRDTNANHYQKGYPPNLQKLNLNQLRTEESRPSSAKPQEFVFQPSKTQSSIDSRLALQNRKTSTRDQQKRDSMGYTLQKGYTNLKLQGSGQKSLFGKQFPQSVRSRKQSMGLPNTNTLTPRLMKIPKLNQERQKLNTLFTQLPQKQYDPSRPKKSHKKSNAEKQAIRGMIDAFLGQRKRLTIGKKKSNMNVLNKTSSFQLPQLIPNELRDQRQQIKRELNEFGSKLTNSQNHGTQHQNQPRKQSESQLSRHHNLPQDPQLICEAKVLPISKEHEIKEGFFELRQKFKSVGASSIYISHIVLHEKHPIFCKLQMRTLKQLLTESNIIQLVENQVLYKAGQADMNIYFILFGSIALIQKNDLETVYKNLQPGNMIGKVQLGSTLGEEILFDINGQVRREEAFCERESCLIGISKNKLFLLQKSLLDEGNQKDYYAIESALRGNYLLKDGWRGLPTNQIDFN